MKLTKTKLLDTLGRKNEGWTTYQARKIAGISIRRVNQVWTEYNKTGTLPVIGKNVGRPKRMITEEETKIVKEAYTKYRVSASTLERIIIRDYKIKIPHNTIHKIMLSIGLAKAKKKKDIRKKNWIRYERRHSLTAVHIDWHYDGKVWSFGVIDDASRKMLSLIECNSPTTEYSIQGMEEALTQGKIKQCVSDHGSQFIARVNNGNSKFKEFLKSKNIQQILCRIKHPQSNGKIEKWFNTYDNHRHAFASKKEFINWYNEIRPHRSLRFEELETPQQAFLRKLKAEA